MCKIQTDVIFKSPKRPTKLTLIKGFNILGITVDQNVTWDAHITKISIKLARVIGIL